MEKEQLIRGCEKIIDRLAEEEDITERIMIPAVRYALGAEAWIAMSDDARMKAMRDLFRAFKSAFNVKLIDDNMTREDLQDVKNIGTHIRDAFAALISEYPDVTRAKDELHNAAVHVDKILKEYQEPQRETSVEE